MFGVDDSDLPNRQSVEGELDGIERFETSVDLGGLMSVLSKHLYSTPDVAIRELVQNSHDSITRRRMVEPDFAAGAIAVATDPERLRLTVTDNGAGLTERQLHEHLATVGVGATRLARESTDDDELIGMFGLGFLSAFVIAHEVTVTTTSVETPDQTWQYRSRDGFAYTVLPAETASIGTVVDIRLDPAFRDLSTSRMVEGILHRYCRLLTLPISLDGGPPINLSCPWRETASADSIDAMQFADAFESRFEPLATIPVDTADGWLRGLLWIHGGSTYGNADNRRLSAYVRGMLLADNDIELLPRWAGFVSGVVESPRLTPTASRETIQQDASYTETQIVLADALTSGLASIARNQPDVWRRILRRHGEALLGAALADDTLFELLADQVKVATSQGDLPVAALRVGRRVHVSAGSERGFEELLFHALGTPIARGSRYGVLAFIRRYADRRGLEVVEVGTDEGNEMLFEAAEIDAGDRAWLASELAGADEAVLPARFEPSSIPLVVIPDRESELKQRVERDDLDRAAGRGPAALARLHTASIGDRPPVRVYVNVGCPTITHLLHARHANPVGAMRAVTFLRSIKTLMVAADHERGGQSNLRAAFEDTLAVLDGLLLEGDVT